MISWISVVVAVSLVFMIYFLWKGIAVAMSDRSLPEPEEGDYEIQVMGRMKNGSLLAVMTPRKSSEKVLDETQSPSGTVSARS